MMKKYFLALSALITLNFSLNAQFSCGINQAIAQLEKQNPNWRLGNNPGFTSANNSISTQTSFTIPVVFHVLHLGGSENISDAQIQNAVQILNRDFNKKNADTINIVPAFQNIAARCAISFSLATLDPNGKCTNGITRHYDVNTNWVNDINNYQYTWPPSQYMNIYVVKTMMAGVAGYAYYPGSAPSPMDGIVILHNYVGSIGTGFSGGSRSLTHEVGHWFNLAHVWGSTNNPGVACGDDGVSDTPITKGFGSCNLGNAAICNPPVQENIQNYMEYAFCSNMFTNGQKARMHVALNSFTGGRNNLSTTSNLIATGLINPTTNCAPTADYSFLKKITCVGNSLNFTQFCYNGVASNFLWTSPNASNSSTLANGNLTFSLAGNTTVKLKASNSFGADSITKSNFIVLSAPNTGVVNQLQDFENFTLPNNNWIIDIPQYGASYSLSTLNGNKSYFINNYYDNPNQPVSLFSPDFNLSNNAIHTLKFNYSYSQTTPQNNDQFEVLASTDCGNTWVNIFNKSGANLSTTGALQNSPFTPTINQWQSASIPLTQFVNNNKVYFRFRLTPDINGAGNNFYLDNIIVVNGITSIKENTSLSEISIYPNPSNSIVNINSNVNISAIKIYNSLGICVLDEFNSSKHINNFTVENLQKGCYTLLLKTSEGMYSKKIIVN